MARREARRAQYRQENGGAAGEGSGRHSSRPYIPYYFHHAQQGSEVSCFIKYVVFGFNVIFWLLGAGILFVGVYALIEKRPVSEIGKRLDMFHLDPAWLLIILGGVTFILGFSGCIGALRENTCLLGFYSIVVSLLLFAQLALAVLGFVFRDYMTSKLAGQMDQMIVRYRDDEDLRDIIDWIQGDWLHCCGVQSPDDWDKNKYFNSSAISSGSPEAGGVPYSCCDMQQEKDRSQLENLFCGHEVRREDYKGEHRIYDIGCIAAGTAWVNENLTIIGPILIGIAIIQILSICFSQSLRSDILAQRARWRTAHPYSIYHR